MEDKGARTGKKRANGTLRWLRGVLWGLTAAFLLTGAAGAMTVRADAEKSAGETGQASAEESAAQSESQPATEEASDPDAQDTSGRSSETGRTIRVAFPTQEGMSFIGHSGKVTGYNYDYLEKISEYTGWNMDYVLYASDDGNEAVGNAITDLTEGKADLMGPLLKNEATEEMFEFPEHSYGTVYTTLNALTSSGLREQNLVNLDVLRVGLWEQAQTRNSEVITFLDAENLPYKITYYDSAEAQNQALLDGDVDVISSVSLSPIANTRIVAQFAPRPYYFASTKGNKELVEELDRTIVKIDQTEPKLQDTLYDTYFRTVEDSFLMTSAEEEALKKMGTVRALCVDDEAPFVYQKDGEPAGMLISILNDFAEKTGLDIQYTFCENRSEAEELLGKQHFDLLLGALLTSGDCAKLGVISSAPVMEQPVSYAQKPNGSRQQKTFALVRGLEDQIDTSGYESTILCDSEKDAIEAVRSGKADLAAGNRSVLEYYIYETGSALVTSMIPGQEQKLCAAVSRDCSTEFLASLNNYIYSISEAELASYLSSGNQHSDSITPVLFVRRHPLQAVLLCLIAAAVIMALIAILLTRSARQKATMQELHNTQLKEALQIAQDANAAKTMFLSNMSHDIRTPMNAVIGFATLLNRESDDAVKVREYSRKITAASNHLLGLINDILDISKIESGKIAINQAVFSIDELMESINVVVRPMAAAKKQAFQINMGKMEHELYVGDKVRVNQVLINLLSNAVKYTPLGGHIRFDIKDLGPSSGNFERLRFCVADDGYGVSKEFQKIIFDPFTRAESTTVNKEVGTGLGLAITKNIVDLMGGTITLDSEVGKGSTFTVELPLRIPHEEQDDSFWENHGVSRILLVDDDKDVIDNICSMMKDTGVEFDTACDGKTAVKKVREEYAAGHEYSTIILDWQMPGMNGLDTAREIRKIIPIDTPVLFLTSYDWSSIETEALEIDVDGFLAKPFTVVNLMEKLIDVERFKNSVSGTDVQIDLKGRHFLAAEDNALNAEILVEILKSEGAACDIAENGQIAVDMFTNAPEGTYDAILMDVMMPVLNGYDATKMIRQSGHPEAMSIPIIAMTANAFVRDVQDALDAGMNAHLAKPMNLEALKNTLGSCLQRK